MITRRLHAAMYENTAVVGRRVSAYLALCSALAAVLYVVGG